MNEISSTKNIYGYHYKTNDLKILEYHLSINTPSLFKVKTLDKVQKMMYIYKINQDKSITGLTFESIPNLSQSQRIFIEDCEPERWQMQTFVAKSFSLDSYLDPLFDISSVFIKYGWDKHLKYGDGGHCDLIYPLYRIQNLPLDDEKLRFLVESLKTLAKQRKDHHKDAPVLDIIDPDLNPNYFYSPSARSEISERSRYAWFPVDVLLRQDGSVKALGEIHNLAKEGNERLYECIFEVFKEMIPGFKLLNIFEERAEQIVQVVVKVQAYLIKPRTAYSGTWHVEGKTENVVAAGVFYCKIEPELADDFLSFHPREAPASFYCQDSGTVPQINVPVNERAAIVFSNSLPHRFCRLENSTDENIFRIFMNFFIIDSKKRLETNQLRNDSFKVLKAVSKLPDVLIGEILSYVYSKLNINEAINRRETARQAMKLEKNGWGFINYGNSGDVVFIDDVNRDEEHFNEIGSIQNSPTQKIDS